MKRVLLLLLAIMPLLCFSQKYSEVVQTEGRNADQLYAKAKEWFALSFNSANDVIQLDDPTNKKIIGKGVQSITYTVGKTPTSMDVHYTLMVETKDNRYKQSVSNIYFSSLAGEKFNSETIQQCTSVEGLTNYYKEIGMKPWVIGKKQLRITAEAYKQLLLDVDKEIESILASLKNTMTTTVTNNSENW